MKKIILIVSLFISVHSQAKAFLKVNEVLPAYALSEGGAAVGNGGGTVICRDTSTRVIKSAELLDFYEARVVRDIEIDISKFNGTWKEKAQAVIDRLGKESQLRQNIYSTWLKDFDHESKFLKGVEFSKVPDSMHIGVPVGCEFEQAAIQIFPRFAGDERYYINQDIWDALDDNNKAGLILHEIIYREALSYGHTDSIATRFFLSHIASETAEYPDFESWIRLLNQVHFEQTDVALADQNISIEFNPILWWRMEDDEIYQKPDLIKLQGRTVINVGYCKNEGCTQWVKTFGYNEVCSGVEKIWVPGYSEPVTVRTDFYVLDNENKCSNPLSIRDSLLSLGDLEIQAQSNNSASTSAIVPLTLEYKKSNLINASKIIFSKKGYNYNLLNVWSKYISDENLLLRGKTTITGSYINECEILAVYNNEKISSASFMGSLEEWEKCKPVGKSKGVQQIAFIISDNLHNPIIFDQNEVYQSGGEVISIFNAVSKEAFTCSSDIKGCIYLQKFNGEFIQEVLISGGSGNITLPYYTFPDANNSSSFGDCQLADGVYDFYDNTLVPKILSLRETCQLLFQTTGQPDKKITYAKGSVLSLNAEGKVTNVILGGNQ